MAKVVFYEVYEIETFVFRFLEKLYRSRTPTIVFCKNKEEVEVIDDGLWTFRQLSFIPHLTCFDEEFNLKEQMFYISVPPYKNPNKALTVLNISGCLENVSDSSVETIVEVYDFQQNELLEGRKKNYSSLIHWRQNNTTWEKL